MPFVSVLFVLALVSAPARAQVAITQQADAVQVSIDGQSANVASLWDEYLKEAQ